MTRSELILALREELLDDVSDAQVGTDLTVQLVSDARLGRWLMDGEREACRRRFNLILDDTFRITLRTGVRSYRLDSLILRIKSIYYDGARLTHTTELALDRDVTGWRDYDGGAPTAFYINNHNLFLDRAPTATENGTIMSLEVWREPYTSDDMEEEPEIPASQHYALTNWAAYRYFLIPDPHIRDDTRAMFFLKQFEEVFGPARSAEILEFKLEEPGWSDIGNGGYSHSWPGVAERGAKGETGDAGADSTVPGPQGDRGSLFLGSYATSASLPTIDGDTVRIGDFAYVEDTGELWRAA